VWRQSLLRIRICNSSAALAPPDPNTYWGRMLDLNIQIRILTEANPNPKHKQRNIKVNPGKKKFKLSQNPSKMPGNRNSPSRSDQIFWQRTVYFSRFSRRLALLPRRTSSRTFASSKSRDTKFMASACSSGFLSPCTISLRRIFKARMDFSKVISATSFCPSRSWARRLWTRRKQS